MSWLLTSLVLVLLIFQEPFCYSSSISDLFESQCQQNGKTYSSEQKRVYRFKVFQDFIRPISRVLFTEVGGSTLYSHHGFVVEYGTDRDVDLGFHVDDAEVTLNVCLGKQFTGGELFFRGVRCEKHVNTETQPEEMFDYSHVAGHAILHCGRHRHGARATTSGRSINLLIWCRSSVFREMRKYQTDFSSWCAECKRDKKERMR